ncbi:MAG: hypothetical protein GKR88_11310 [Flavobacteriaceae bacterium]|nr:MAG: hypothetical protein GKR88_11310 [Flavobacteriaceae bacterium]
MSDNEERKKRHNEAMNRLFERKNIVALDLQNKEETLERLKNSNCYSTAKEKEIAGIIDPLGEIVDSIWVEEFCLKIQQNKEVLSHKKIKNILSLEATIKELNAKKNELENTIKTLNNER